MQNAPLCYMVIATLSLEKFYTIYYLHALQIFLLQYFLQICMY
uniref:Uncharacterized protein n=1 Tax=Anguilla anguilla TaxID=7936 RepID=A0A0E9TAJ4_ANGAN